MNNEALNEWMEDSTDINQIQAKVDKAVTPKEKAINLFNSYVKLLPLGSNVERAKQGVIIAVDEILSVIWHAPVIITYNIEYWKEVKQEIEKL